MQTNLLGRQVRGKYSGLNPEYDRERGEQVNNRRWVDISVDGELVGITVDGDHWLVLDADCRVRKCWRSTVVVLPRDHVGPLR